MYVKWQNVKIVDNLTSSEHNRQSAKELRRQNISGFSVRYNRSFEIEPLGPGSKLPRKGVKRQEIQALMPTVILRNIEIKKQA
jgi:hypothetical protein